MRRSVYDTELQSSLICRWLHAAQHHLYLWGTPTQASKHAGINESKKANMEKIGNFSNFPSRTSSEAGCYRRNAAQRAHRRPSVAGRPVLGVRVEGFCGCDPASGLAGLIYRRRGDMCRGYSQCSLVGAKTATLLLPAHLESRLSGSAERLTPSLRLTTSMHLCLRLCCPLITTVCVAATAQLKFKISSHVCLPPTHFSCLYLSPPCPKSIWWRTKKS